jgi:hypothetical protein
VVRSRGRPHERLASGCEGHEGRSPVGRVRLARHEPLRNEYIDEAAGRSRLKLAASYEAGIWRSLYRWLTRQPSATDPAAALFGYAIPGHAAPARIHLPLGARDPDPAAALTAAQPHLARIPEAA